MPMLQLMMVVVNMQWKIMTVMAIAQPKQIVLVNAVVQQKLMNAVSVVATVLT
jgi:hypothetical protein